MRAEVIASIKAADLSVFKLDRLDLDSTLNIEFFDDAFDDLRSFDDYLMSFGFTGDWEFSEELEHATNRALQDIEEEMTAKFEQLDRDLESGSFWEKTKAVLTMGKMALTIERTVLCYVNEAFDRLEVSLIELLRKYAKDELGLYLSGVVPSISAIVASALGAGAGFALGKLGR
ncbi:MAG: hypothetical protein GX772_10510 [Alcaligenaceae bacterium]|nr:hypothetical protein [Alcaligenaceae bacterium]